MGRADGTIRWLDVGLTRFAGWCARQGITHVDVVTKRAVRAHWLYLHENLKSVSTAASCVRAFFKWLEREGELECNPVKDAGFPKDKRQTIRPLTLKEVEAMLQSAKSGRNGKRDVALMLFLFDTGLRISEALSVTVEGLDTGNSLVTVFGKGGKTRTVAYGYRTSRALKDYLRWDRPDF